MKIHILSDLHNEFMARIDRYPDHLWSGAIVSTDADVVVLAGDIDTGTKGVEWAIKQSERLSKPVLYVMGNHEFYHHEYYELKKNIRSICKGTNVHFLDCDEFIFGGVRFLGLTLWTDYKVPGVSRELARAIVEVEIMDHRVILFEDNKDTRRFATKDAYSIHKKEIKWLNSKLDEPFDGKTVIITHHGPHLICQHPLYPNDVLSTAFYSDLSPIIDSRDISAWIFGHTHANLDQIINNTRLVSNQAGYPGEYVDDFESTKIIEI